MSAVGHIGQNNRTVDPLTVIFDKDLHEAKVGIQTLHHSVTKQQKYKTACAKV